MTLLSALSLKLFVTIVASGRLTSVKFEGKNVFSAKSELLPGQIKATPDPLIKYV